MRTMKEIRDSFWENHPEFKKERRVNKSQNDYTTDIRCAFVDYVDSLERQGIITQKLADRVTLK